MPPGRHFSENDVSFPQKTNVADDLLISNLSYDKFSSF